MILDDLLTISEIIRLGIGASFDDSKFNLLKGFALDTCSRLQALLSVNKFLILLHVRVHNVSVLYSKRPTALIWNRNGMPWGLLGSF